MTWDENRRNPNNQQAVASFAQSLVELFGMPKPPNGSVLTEEQYGARWSTDLVEDLGGFNSETLERARKILRQTTKYKSMPNNSEIIAAAKEAYNQIEKEKPKLKLVHKSQEERTVEAAENIAIELMRISPLGKRACNEGWHGELFAFVRDNGHLPRNQSEVNLLIEGAKGTDKRIEGLISGGVSVPDGLREKLINLGESMLARRDAVARAIVDGEVFDWGRR